MQSPENLNHDHLFSSPKFEAGQAKPRFLQQSFVRGAKVLKHEPKGSALDFL